MAAEPITHIVVKHCVRNRHTGVITSETFQLLSADEFARRFAPEHCRVLFEEGQLTRDSGNDMEDIFVRFELLHLPDEAAVEKERRKWDEVNETELRR